MYTTRSISPLTGLALILGGCGVLASLVFAACGQERDHTPTAPIAAQVSANTLSPDQLLRRVNHVADLVQRANTRFDDIYPPGTTESDPGVFQALFSIRSQAQALADKVNDVLSLPLTCP
jgi:hypothetical protein